jgi:hypothetical protein
MSLTDWGAWHADYADPESALSERLRVIQGLIDGWLDSTTPRHVSVVSACAGEGRDLLQVLERRKDAGRVRATLLEGDPAIAARARHHVTRLGLSDLEVRCADAGQSDAYAGAVPADLVLLCGVFGNISDDDVRRTIAFAPQLCARQALVIWTRHRRAPDLTPSIRAWFGDRGFTEEDFVAPQHALYTVGAHRFLADPMALHRGTRVFTFTK